MGLSGSAQINYFEGFEASEGGWTTTQGGRSNNAPCIGLWSMRWNVGQTSTGTMQLNSPLIGVSNGLPATYSFVFRRSASAEFGGMRSYWATSPSGPWSLTTHSVGNQNCNTYTVNFNPPPGQQIYLRLEVTKNFGCCFGSSKTFWFDDITVTQEALQCPAAAFSVSDNCGVGMYQLTANVSTAGPGAQLQYSVDGVPQTPVAIPGNGVISTPNIPVHAAVTYTMTNDHVALGCSTLNGYLYSTCPITLDCNSLLTIEHCYRNLDDRTWHFVNPNANTMDIQWLASSPIVSGDGISFFNGPPGVNPTGVPGPLNGDLANIGLYTTAGSVFSFSIAADGAGSCEDGVAGGNWTIEVKCTPDCFGAQADVYVQPSNCGAGTFTMEVDLYDLGETNGVYNDVAGIRYIVDNGAPVDMLNLTEDLYPIGPFPHASDVTIILLHENEALCNNNLGVFNRITPCAPANDLCAFAAPLTVNTPGACMGAAVTGTTFDAGVEIGAPSCADPGTIRDVWYSFNSGYNSSPLAINITPGTIDHYGVQVFSGSCGGTPILCADGSPATVNVPGLSIFTNYWIRVFTNTNLGAAGTFNICLSASPIPSNCGTTVYDTGGPGGNYGQNQNYSVTYCSSNFGDQLTASFTQFQVGNFLSPATLSIYNGPSTASPLVGNYTWTTAAPSVITSSHPSGCLTFAFTSGGGFLYSTEAGWTANLTCCVAPNATATASVVQTPVCLGSNIQLQASSDIGTVFSWTGPAGFTSSAQNPTRTNAAANFAGNYTVVARNGPNGCPSAPSTVSVSVVPPPSNVTASSNKAFACVGSTVNLGATATGSGLTYAWTSSPAGFTSALQNPSGVVINETTTYTVEVSSAPGCSNSANVTVNVGAALTASINGPASYEFCFGPALNLTSTVNGGGEPYTLEWYDGATLVGTGPTLDNYVPAATTTISLQASDGCGGSTTATSVPVTVHPLPTVVVTPDIASNCDGGTSVLEASGALSYSWSPAVGLSATTGPVVTADPPNVVNIYTVTGTDANNCVNSAIATVYVASTPDIGTTSGAVLCVNGSLLPGDGLTASCEVFTASIGEAFPGTNFPTNIPANQTTFHTVSTVTLPPLPPGAIQTSARLILNNVQALTNFAGTSWLSEIRVRTLGAIALPETQISAINSSGTVAQVVINLPLGSYPAAGGLVNLQLRETVNDGVLVVFGIPIADNLDPDGRVGNATVEVDYEIPTTSRWYDAPVGGTVVSNNSLFNPITENAVSNAVGGTYTFYAVCQYLGCESPRVPTYFSVGDKFLNLELNTDVFAGQTSWEVENTTTGQTVCSGGPYFNGFALNLVETCCVPDGCYNLRVFDSAGDGITNGGYSLRNSADNRRIIDNRNNGDFGSVSQITGNAYSFCIPMGNDELIYTSCDKYWWRTAEYIVATENPAVSAIWVDGGANNVQSNSTGYEFWFYNPNGGYSFRKFRSHNVSDGMGNIGATRSCHLKINNWAAASHIPEGELMNVKVRGRVLGNNLAWGPACRFVRDEALALCPPTKLMDIPGNVNLSCGQFRQFVGGQRVYARPIGGATQYQWRFRIPAENVEIIRSTNNYILPFPWNVNLAPHLLPGKTYEVDVRAFKNGAWCVEPLNPDSAWGDVCLLTIQAPPAQDGTQNLAMEQDGGLNIWPNPNQGDQFRLTLDAIAEDVMTVAVDIHDLSGKRVLAREIPVNDRNLNTVIDLNGDLANGMYMVNITAGEMRYTERLVIAR